MRMVDTAIGVVRVVRHGNAVRRECDYRLALNRFRAEVEADDVVALPFTPAQIAIALVVSAVGLGMWAVAAWGVAVLMGLL